MVLRRLSSKNTPTHLTLVDTILKYRIPPEKGDYSIAQSLSSQEFTMNLDPRLRESSQEAPSSSQDSPQRSNLRLFPPPIFNRQSIPIPYG